MAERLDDLCASFKRHLRAEKKAERTGVLYGMLVRMYSEWLAARPQLAAMGIAIGHRA